MAKSKAKRVKREPVRVEGVAGALYAADTLFMRGYGPFCGLNCAAEYAVRVQRVLMPVLTPPFRDRVCRSLVKRRA